MAGGAVDPLKGVSFFSEKQFQCGASIAALRVAVGLSMKRMKVAYNYQVPSKSPFLRDRFPSVDFKQVGAAHSKYAQETIKAAEDRSPAYKARLTRQFFEQYLRIRLKHGATDVAHIHNYSGSRAPITDIASHRPLVWTMHDTSPVTGYHYRTYGVDGAPLEYRAKLTPGSEAFWESLRGKPFALTAPSRWLTEYARASVPDFITVRHIPNIVPSEKFYPMDKSLARSLIGIPEKGTYILFFAGKGAWERKNFEILARAFAAEPDLPVNALVVGGVANSQLMKDPRLTFLNGFDPVRDAAKIVALYNAVDAFCISSLVDNLPNTVLEAISCGRPVIAANAGGVSDMVEDGVNGWLFNPRDTASAVAALRRFQGDLGRLDEMGDASLKRAKTDFAPDAVLTQFSDLYVELLQSHQRNRRALTA